MSHKVQLITAIFLTAYTCSTFAASAPSKIVNSYPACDYQVIDSIQVNTSFQAVTNEEFVENYHHAVEQLLPRLKKVATKINASYVAITDKTLRSTSAGRKIVSLHADAIAECEISDTKEEKLAPYNEFGQKQVSFSLSPTTIETSMIIDTSPKKPLRPQLSDNLSISLTSGLYGISLGATEQNVISQFGTPSYEQALSKDSRLLSYGREHWLTFNGGKLEKVEFNNSDMTWTLKNLIPVDDRFKDRNWYISEAMRKGATFKTNELSTIDLNSENESAALYIKTTDYRQNDQQHSVVKITGFELLSKSFKSTVLSGDERKIDNGMLAHLYSLTQSITAESNISIPSLGYEPYAIINDEEGDIHLLLSPIVMVETTGNLVHKITIDPDLSDKPNLSEWEFGPFKYNQSVASAMKEANNDAFFFDNVLELDKGKYVMKLFFEEDKVKSLEVSLY